MQILLRPRLKIAGLLVALAIVPAARAMMIADGCGTLLTKSDFAQIASPFADEMRDLTRQWRDIDVLLEWVDGVRGYRMIAPTLAEGGAIRLPRVELETLRGPLIVSSEAFVSKDEIHTNAWKARLQRSGDRNVLLVRAELDLAKPASQFRLMIDAALSAMPTLDAFQLEIDIKRESIMDPTGPGTSLSEAEVERLFGPSTHRLNVERKRLFESILALKRLGDDDAEILTGLNIPLFNFMLFDLGPWRLHKLRIAAEGRMPVFDNDDAIVITYLFVKP